MADESFATRRLDSLLLRIRESLHKTLDAFQAKAFCGSLDEVLTVTPEDVNSFVSYLLDRGLTQEEAQQLRDEWERCWEEGGFLQVLMRNPPYVIDYSASADDPDDPEAARIKQVNAERFADHEREMDHQRGIAIDAVSALLKHVDDLVETVKTAPGNNGNRSIAPATTDVETIRTGASWQKVAESLESLRLKGEAFKSQAVYAEQLECSPATVNKAIDRTPSLKEWSTKPVSSTSWGGNVTDVILDETPQTREAAPAAIVEPADADAALAYLLEHASPEERAKIHAMAPDQQRHLAELAYNDPDRERVILEDR